MPEWVVTQLAAGRIGAVLVNVNPAYRLHELQDALAMADVATLVVGSPFKGSNFVAMVESLCPEVAAASSRDWSSHRFPRLRRLIALGERPGPGWWNWTDLETGPRASSAELRSRTTAVLPTDVHNIQFTSGTTGLPKGAMLTHRNVLMNAYYTGERLRYSAADRVCVPVPFYHCFGCVLGTMVVRGSWIGGRGAGPFVRRGSHPGRYRRRALHGGLRRSHHVYLSARTSGFRDDLTCRACARESCRERPAPCR